MHFCSGRCVRVDEEEIARQHLCNRDSRRGRSACVLSVFRLVYLFIFFFLLSFFYHFSMKNTRLEVGFHAAQRTRKRAHGTWVTARAIVLSEPFACKRNVIRKSVYALTVITIFSPWVTNKKKGAARTFYWPPLRAHTKHCARGKKTDRKLYGAESNCRLYQNVIVPTNIYPDIMEELAAFLDRSTIFRENR